MDHNANVDPRSESVMDPNTNLERQLQLARDTLTWADNDGLRGESPEDAGSPGIELAEYVVALHEWIANGGVLPVAWANVVQDYGTQQYLTAARTQSKLSLAEGRIRELEAALTRVQARCAWPDVVRIVQDALKGRE